jgi:CheY-like chemotaxis protein
MERSLMAKVKGAIILIDDDKEEHELMKMALDGLGLKNELKCFIDGDHGYNYLRETKDDIFLVLSDVNMPRMDGLALKRLIEATPELKMKSIPFFFHSNSATPAEVRTAYSLGIQGYIKKGLTISETQSSLEKILALWTEVVHPKDFVV